MALTDLCIECRSLEPRENPFCGFYARQFDTMMIELALYLSALMRDVREAGGRIVVRRFNTPADILRLSERVVFNCTGLGARDLFGDVELVPAKGQLVVLRGSPRRHRTARRLEPCPQSGGGGTRPGSAEARVCGLRCRESVTASA